MSWFDNRVGRPKEYPGYKVPPFPVNTNCEPNAVEVGAWHIFVMSNQTRIDHVTGWFQLDRNYYRAELDDGGVIFFIQRSNGGYESRYLTAEEAKFKTEGEWSREFSRRFYYLLDDRSVTQDDISKKTGISASALSYYRHHQRVPSSYTIVQLADAFGTSIDFLIKF